MSLKSTEVFGVTQMPEGEKVDQTTEDKTPYYAVLSELARGMVTNEEAFEDVMDARESEARPAQPTE